MLTTALNGGFIRQCVNPLWWFCNCFQSYQSFQKSFYLERLQQLKTFALNRKVKKVLFPTPSGSDVVSLCLSRCLLRAMTICEFIVRYFFVCHCIRWRKRHFLHAVLDSDQISFNEYLMRPLRFCSHSNPLLTQLSATLNQMCIWHLFQMPTLFWFCVFGQFLIFSMSLFLWKFMSVIMSRTLMPEFVINGRQLFL